MVATAAHHQPPLLVGRERERALLGERLAAALAGQGGLVLLGGEAGIGKTTLAEAAVCEAAARGALVLVGRCYDLSETPPYGPWAEALTDIYCADNLPVAPDLACGCVASQTALFAQARDYLATLAATQPVVLLLEDLHWADHASLELLRFVARGLVEVPLLLLATYRDDEPSGERPLTAFLPALVREARAERLALHRLSGEATQALVHARYHLPAVDEARLVAYLQAHAEGNPLYLGELLRTLEEEGLLRPATAGAGWALGDVAGVRVPPLLRQVIGARVARLGEQAGRLLAVAAVIGQDVPLDAWSVASGADEDALAGVVGGAVAARLMAEVPDGQGVRFAHALVREALYSAVPLPRRRTWHRRAGEVLAALPNPDPDAVAYHLRQAGDPRAGEWLVRAGERARRGYAWLTAAERYEAALALQEAGGGDAGWRGWLAYQLASLRSHADARWALAHAEDAVRLGGAAGDPLLAALGTFRAGKLRCMPAIYDRRRGIPLMEAGLAALAALPAAARVPPGESAPLDPAPLWGTVILHLGWSGRYADALARGERHLAEVPPPAPADWAGTIARADVFHGLGHVYAGLGQPDRARAALARARELRHDVGHHLMAAGAAWDEALVVEWYAPDRPAELAGLLAWVAETRGRAVGLDAGHATRRAWEVPGLLRGGRWAALRAVAEALVGTADDPYVPELGRFDRAQGRPEAAWARVRRLLPEGPTTEPGDPDLLFALPLQRLAADLALDAGDLAAARAWLAAHDRWLEWSGAVLGRAEGALGWAAVHRAAGDGVLASEHAERALVLASAPRQPLALLAAHRLLGELDTDAGRYAAAAAHLDIALALADACEAPYERALVLLAAAEVRHASGDRDRASAALEDARAILAQLEARPALARVEALEARLADAATAREGSPDGLSRREAEVLALVAAGRSHRQIAATLGLSPRTVQRHVANAYLKIGAHNKAEATAYALRHALA